MADWELLAQNSIDRTSGRIDKGVAAVEVEKIAENYNIPGVTRMDRGMRSVALENGNNFVAMSPVGGNITCLELNGNSIYFPGAIPYALPFLNENGIVEFYSPDFYRFIGHHVVPAANQDEGFNEEVHKRLEKITGRKLSVDFYTGHHGISQCRVGEVNRSFMEQRKGNIDLLSYSVYHPADKANLLPFREQMDIYLDLDGGYVEEISLYNFKNRILPVSLLRHPYFLVPAETFNNAVIYKVSVNGRREALYNLSDYIEMGEARFPLPLIENDEWVEFDRGDGVTVKLEFSGDYPESAGLQIFSNGPTSERLIQDYIEKFEIHKIRLKAARDFMSHIGFDTSWYNENSLNDEMRLHIDMLRNFCSVCIEDATSVGNIYRDLDGVESAVLIPKGHWRTFVRRTSVV